MIRSSALLMLTLVAHAPVSAQGLHFQCGGKPVARATQVTPQTPYSTTQGHGFRTAIAGAENGTCASDKPFLFDITLNEGNYDVTVTLGDPTRASETTVKAESRRLMLEKVQARAKRAHYR